MQPNHQTRRQARTADVLREQMAKLPVKKRPSNLIGQLEEGVFRVELTTAVGDPLADKIVGWLD